MENSELKTRLFGAEKENQRGPYKRKAKKEKTVLKSKGPLNLPTSPDLSNDEFTRLEANYEFYKKCSKPIKTNEDSDLDYLDSSRFMDLDMSDEWLSSSEKKLMYFRANVNKASLEQPNQVHKLILFLTNFFLNSSGNLCIHMRVWFADY